MRHSTSYVSLLIFSGYQLYNAVTLVMSLISILCISLILQNKLQPFEVGLSEWFLCSVKF